MRICCHWAAWLVVGTLLACSPEEEPTPPVRPVRTETVGAGDGMEWLTFGGVTAPVEGSALAFRVSGQVLSVEVDVGDEVEARDVLATLDPSDFELAAEQLEGQIAGAEATLDAMRTGEREERLEILRAQLRAADATLSAQETNYERYQVLLDEGTISQREFDEVEARYLNALSTKQEAEQALHEGETGAREEDIRAQESQISSLQARLETARNSINYTVLRAPFDGRVITRTIDPAEQVQAQQTVFTLYSLGTLEMTVGLPEEIFRLRGQELSLFVTLSSLPDVEFEVTEHFMSADLDPNTQTYPATVRFANSDGQALPGMSGEVHVGVAGDADSAAVTVPLTALFERPDGQRAVWVVEGDRVRAQAVEIDETSESEVRVLSGLEDGDVVVTAGVNSLHEDMQVRVLGESADEEPAP